MAIAGKNANVYITAQTATTSLAEDFDLVSGTTATYQIVSSSKRHWDVTSATRPRILVSASTVGVPSYDVNYVQGIVTFSSAPASTAVTGDVEWVQASEVAEGRAWQLNVTQDLFETPIFGSGGWRTFSPNVVGATVNISRYAQGTTDGAEFFDLLNTDSQFIVELYADETAADKYEAYGYVTQDSIQGSVDGVFEESVDININGAVYYTTSP